MTKGGSRGKRGGGGFAAENATLNIIDKKEQISLSDGLRITKIERNLYMIDNGNLSEPSLLNRNDTKLFLSAYKKELQNSGAKTPIEKLIDKKIQKEKVKIVKPKRQPPKYEYTPLKMTEIINIIDRKNKLYSGSAEIDKIDSKTYLIRHPDLSSPRVVEKSELRAFIRSNVNDFDGFRKGA